MTSKSYVLCNGSCCGFLRRPPIPGSRGSSSSRVESGFYAGIPDGQVKTLLDDLEKMMPQDVRQWINWEQSICDQGPRPRKSMLRLLFKHDTGVSTQLNNVNASTRALIWSTLWTDVGLPTTTQEGGATRFCVTVRSRQHALRRAGAADSTGLAATVRGDHSKKTTQSLLNETEEKTWLYQLHGDTQGNGKPHLNSAQEQAERPETHHRILTPHSIPLAILEMLLPQSCRCENLEKASTEEYYSTGNKFERFLGFWN